MKDTDPLGPNYYVLRDELTGALNSTWRLWLTADRVELAGDRVRVIGKDDVDMDVIFLSGPPAGMTVEEAARTSVSSAFNNAPVTTKQFALRVPLSASDTVAVLLYPRLKTQPSPRVTPLAGGQSARIETKGRADTVYLGAKPFTATTMFRGTAGLATEHDGHETLALGAPGMIAAGDKTLEAGKALSRSWGGIP